MGKEPGYWFQELSEEELAEKDKQRQIEEISRELPNPPEPPKEENKD